MSDTDEDHRADRQDADDRERRRQQFYRLNGQISSVRKSLWSSLRVLMSMTETGDPHVKALSDLYDSLRAIQNRIFDKYCR